MNTFATGFLIAMIFMAGFMTYVITHEATHLALSNEPYGICLGRCEYNTENEMPQKETAFATAIGQHNKQSMQETIPTITGLLAMYWVIIVSFLSIMKIGKKEAKKKDG